MRSGILFFIFIAAGYFISNAQNKVPDTFLINFSAGDTVTSRGLYYSLVKLKDGEEIAALTTANLKPIRQLSRQHFIISAPKIAIDKFEYASPANNNWKLSPELFDLYHVRGLYPSSSNLYSLVLSNVDAFNKDLSEQHAGISISREYADKNIAIIRIDSKEAFESILSFKSVVHIACENRIPLEEQAINSLDLTANKVNYIHSQASSLNGAGLTLSVKENKPDTGDIDFKGRMLFTSLSSNIVSNHATAMCTVAAGAGNSFYTGKGVAWGAWISSSNFAPLLPDHDSDYIKYDIIVQNHSYGTGIENYYGHDAMAYDISSNNNRVLLHVFSAGNSGNLASASGNYAGVEGFANITGSFKMAKNILTVGSTDSLCNVAAASSKGPAFDGRVKPELVAFGDDGSSGAAAIVSGICLLLQQAYKEKNPGQFPASALLKAVLINSADDVGLRGIDYSSGYGNVNAYKALNTILEGRHLSGSIEQSGGQAFDIQVPNNVKDLKITLCWNDPASTANAFTALVNNVDMQLLHSTTGVRWEPWVLSSFAHKDSLQLLSIRKKDNLNNVELITVEDPIPGNYRIQVSGTAITGSQQFYIAYQWDTLNSFRWMHPANNDNLLAGNDALLRWQSSFQNTGRIEYSLNGGTGWTIIDSNTYLPKNYYRWAVPDTFSTALLRMTINDKIYSSDTFTISKPLRAYVGYNCPDSLLLFWNKLNLPATKYVLYNLGTKYLEAISSNTDSATILDKSAHLSLYYAISPVLSNGREGMKSYSFNYTAQGTGCYLKSFLADKQDDATTAIKVELGTNYNVKKIEIEKSVATGVRVLQQIEQINLLSYTITDSILTKGINRYRVKLTLYDNRIIYSNWETAYNIAKNNFIIFANPIQQNQPLHILSDDPANTLFQIFSMDGRQLLQKKLNNTLEQTNLSGLVKGVYIFTISKKNIKVQSGKLIIK